MSDTTVTVTVDSAAETIAVALSGDDLSDNTLSQLGDVTGTPSNNQVLKYSTSTSKWSPAADASAVDSVNGETGTVVLSTSDIAEGTNLYYTNTRADARAQLKIDALVDSAPGALDTLNELAAALGDDASFSSTMTTSLAGKEPTITAGTSSQYYRGDKTFQTLDTTAVTEGTNLYYTNARADARITNAGSANWNTAYGWGNHASAGYITATLTDEQVQDKIGAMLTGNTETLITVAYEDSDGTIDFTVDNDLSNYDNSTSGFLTSETSHADVLQDGDFSSQGIMLRGAGAGTYSILTDASANWNTAYGWGNHASGGYLTSIATDSINDTHIDWGTGTNQVSTADVPENTNLYYTDARARAALSGSGDISYNSSTGVISYTDANRTALQDADNDTKIQVEESADEDIVRIDIGGTERLTLQNAADQLSLIGDWSSGYKGLRIEDSAGSATRFSARKKSATDHRLQVFIDVDNELSRTSTASGADENMMLTYRAEDPNNRIQSWGTQDTLHRVEFFQGEDDGWDNGPVSIEAGGTSSDVAFTFKDNGTAVVEIDKTATEVVTVYQDYSAGNRGIRITDRTDAATASIYVRDKNSNEKRFYIANDVNNDIGRNSSQYISAATVNAGGSGYAVDDKLTIVGGSNAGNAVAAVLNVDSVDGSGAVSGVSLDEDAYWRTGGAYLTAYITDATKANPVVISSDNHPFTNGMVITISGVSGMTELNGNTYTVANKGDDDFELSGINGTGFTTYVSGTGSHGGIIGHLPPTPNSVTTDGSGTSCTLDLTFTSDNESYYMNHRTEDDKDRTDYWTGSTTAGEGYFELRYGGSRDWGWEGAPLKTYAGDANGTQSHAFKYYVNWNNTFNIGSDGPVIPSGKKLEAPLIETDEVQSTGNMLINGNSQYDELDVKFNKMKFSDYDTDKQKFEFNNDLGFIVQDLSAAGTDKTSISLWRENGSNSHNTGYTFRLTEGSPATTDLSASWQLQNWSGSTLQDPKQIMAFDEANRVMIEIPLNIKSYTVAEANALSSETGDVIYVSDGDAGSACLGVFDGSNFKVIALGATISAS